MARSTIRAAVVALVVTTTGLAAPGAVAGTRGDDAHQRGAVVHGRAAIDRLGDGLGRAAARAGQAPGRARHELLTDETVGVDRVGNLVVADPERARISSVTDDVVTPVYDTSDTFALHSRSAAAYTIYLDFTGHLTSGTEWNRAYTGWRDFWTPRMDLDGDPSRFSSLEHAVVQATWLSVREDYAPFDVDVTTEDPGDGFDGIRVVVGPNTWYPEDAGGVGYVGSFDWRDGSPVYVFSDGWVGAKFISEAAAHEAGHSLGLWHDGSSWEEYYEGQGDWAPIMGVGYDRAVTQWSRGEYPDADNGEDDVAVIASYVGWARDDWPSGSSTPGTLPPGTYQHGVVSSPSDRDAFRFRLWSTRTVDLDAWGWTGPVDGNLDLRLTVLDERGARVASAAPPGDQGAHLRVRLRAGRYTVVVQGTGDGSFWSGGYGSYGSRGWFELVRTVR